MVETIENINTPAFYIREELIGEAFMREALLDKVMGKQRFRKSSENYAEDIFPPQDWHSLQSIRLMKEY